MYKPGRVLGWGQWPCSAGPRTGGAQRRRGQARAGLSEEASGSCILRGEILQVEGSVGALRQLGFCGAGQIVPSGLEFTMQRRME